MYLSTDAIKTVFNPGGTGLGSTKIMAIFDILARRISIFSTV